MLSAISGSMRRAGGRTSPSTASASVMLCASVNPDVIRRIRRTPPPMSSSPMTNRMWSGPMKMWWTPARTNVAKMAHSPSAPVVNISNSGLL